MDRAVQFREIKDRLVSAYKEALSLIEAHPEVLDVQDWGPRWVHGIVEGEEGHEEIKRYRHYVVFQTSYGDVAAGCLFVGVNFKRDESLH
jgi:hypothetical protein